MGSIENEITLNQNIYSVIKPALDENQTNNSLVLAKKDISNLAFLAKFLKKNTQIQTLDLSNNNIGNKACKDIASLIESNTTIKVLNLSENKIGGKGLQVICSALCNNQTIEELDIRKNDKIPWYTLKMLLAMLYRNQSIVKIYYTQDPNHPQLHTGGGGHGHEHHHKKHGSESQLAVQD